MIFPFKNGTAPAKVVCAVLFVVFTFLYLYNYQADILSVTQHVLSGGATHYDRTIGAVLITLILLLLQMAVAAVARIDTYFRALTYMPSLLLLGILTDVNPDIAQGHYIGHWAWGLPLVMVGFAALVWLCRQYEAIHITDKSITPLRTLWVNTLLMVALFVMTCFIGSTARVFHYRMRMESLLKDHRYAEASRVGWGEEETDSSLTFLRIWTLSRQHQLGERLFEYPLVGGSKAMLPRADRSVSLMMVPEVWLYKDLGVYFTTPMSPREYMVRLHRQGWATEAAHDWLLCAYLLDGDLRQFAQALPLYYKVSEEQGKGRPSLPKHYREALTLYNHMTHQPLITYRDTVMETDFFDYQELRRKIREGAERYNALRENFGRTYWFYYYSLMARSAQRKGQPVLPKVD